MAAEAPALRFRVRKASKYLFDCAGVDPADAAELQSLALVAVRAEEMATLGIDEVDVRKRLNLDEVDRMIACSQLHPPEIVVAPATTEHREQFESFAKYLTDRKRAGVAPLADGVILLLAPLSGTHGFLRCVVITTETTAGGGDVVAVSAMPLPKKLPSRASAIEEGKTHKASSTPPKSLDTASAVAVPSPAKHSRKRPRHERTASPDGGADGITPADADTAKPNASPAEQAESKGRKSAKARQETTHETQGAVDAVAKSPDTATIDALNRRSRKALFAQLRQEHDTFHASRYERLLRWGERAAPPP